MSRESTAIFQRQWHILMYLSEGACVSTANIRDYLARQGIEAEMRTIQRDLRMLEQVVSLECRRDCMPHGWRWRQGQRVEGLSLTQALTLRLVEEQLHEVLSPALLEELRPLFSKARLVTGQESEEAVRSGLADLYKGPRDYCRKPSRKTGAVPASSGSRLARGLQSLLDSLLPKGDAEADARLRASAALRELMAVLRDNGLEEPAGRL